MARRNIQKINEDMLLEMLRLEYDRRLEKLGRLDKPRQELDVTRTAEPQPRTDVVVSPGLVLKHKQTGVKYQIISIDGNTALVRSPEGEESSVSMRSISADYLID